MTMTDGERKAYEAGLNDGARVCEHIAAECRAKGMAAVANGLALAAKSIRSYEPGILADEPQQATK